MDRTDIVVGEIDMNKWKSLEANIKKWLKKTYSGKMNYFVQLPGTKFRSDGMLSGKNGTAVAVEIEAGQAHPDTNVLKYWYIQRKKPKSYNRIIVCQFFTPGFVKNYGRKTLAEFVGAQIPSKASIEYRLFDLTDYSRVKDVEKEIEESLENIIDDATF